jgi:hypothetical protein
MSNEMAGDLIKFSFLLLIQHEEPDIKETSITIFRCVFYGISLAIQLHILQYSKAVQLV